MGMQDQTGEEGRFALGVLSPLRLIMWQTIKFFDVGLTSY